MLRSTAIALSLTDPLVAAQQLGGGQPWATTGAAYTAVIHVLQPTQYQARLRSRRSAPAAAGRTLYQATSAAPGAARCPARGTLGRRPGQGPPPPSAAVTRVSTTSPLARISYWIFLALAELQPARHRLRDRGLVPVGQCGFGCKQCGHGGSRIGEEATCTGRQLHCSGNAADPQICLSQTSPMPWSRRLRSTTLARSRDGRMFSRRFTRLMSRQMPRATPRAASASKSL